ncbi:MAG: glycosyltransferase family 4 protein [Deltaproteobacteria bacterium]|nr:glycosyltransferase family 4 protein [Deltaproteobacteria bacterium]
MKILYINPEANFGGAERSLVDAIVSVGRLAPDVRMHVILLSEGPLNPYLRSLGLEVSVLRLPRTVAGLGDSAIKGTTRVFPFLLKNISAGVGAIRFGRLLRGAIRKIAPSVIHSNGIKSHILLSLAGLPDRPVVWHLRDFVASRKLARGLLQRYSNRAVRGIAVSKAVAEDVQSFIKDLPTEVIYNGIDSDYFSPGAAQFEWLDQLAGFEPKLDGEIVRVGLVASFGKWKGQAVFLHAASKVLQELSAKRVRFYVVGGAIYQTSGSQFSLEELKALTRKLGIAPSVGFVDFTPEICPVYRSLDIVVHASTEAEPFGRAIVEAMSCGIPVIATRTGGASEIMDMSSGCLGVAPNDIGQLSGAILRLVSDEKLRASMSDKGRSCVLENFSRARLGSRLLEVYKRVSKDRSIS